MATRSRIGIELKDGSILSAYHHWDGYPAWLGRILTTHYNTREQAADLIDGGDMSSCWNDTIWGEDRTDGNKYAPSIILLVVRIALLAMIKPAKSICLMVKSFLISLRVQVGYVMI